MIQAKRKDNNTIEEFDNNLFVRPGIVINEPADSLVIDTVEYYYSSVKYTEATAQTCESVVANTDPVFYEITVDQGLRFGFYTEHTGTFYKADGITNILRNNESVNLPFAVNKNDIVSGNVAAPGLYDMELIPDNGTLPVRGFIGTEGSYNKGVSGYARCYNSIVVEMSGVSYSRNGLIDLNNQILNADTSYMNSFGNFDHHRILSNADYTAFANPGKITIIRNVDMFTRTITVGHSYNTLLAWTDSNMLLVYGYGTSYLIDATNGNVLYSQATATAIYCADLSGQTAFYTYANNWRTIRNGVVTAAKPLAGAYGVLCYNGFAYITATNVIIKVNDQTDAVAGSVALNGTARRILRIADNLYCATSTGWVYEIDIPTFAITRQIQPGNDIGHDIVTLGGYLFITGQTINILTRVRLADFEVRTFTINVTPHRIHIDEPNQLMAFAKFNAGTDGLTNVYTFATLLEP